jgi:predicted nucleic acid-binding Zn ribbon protein
MSELLASVFEGNPAGKRLKEGKIWQVWESAVGPQVALHAWPAFFRDGVLTVTVDSAPWMQQLSFLKKLIIEKLNKRLGEEQVRELYLKAGTVAPQPVVAYPEARQQKELNAADKARIADLANQIADTELRDIMTELMKKHLSTKE